MDISPYIVLVNSQIGMLSSKESSLQAFKTLDDKPNMATKITYKLRADANNGILVRLSEFLKLPRVIEAGQK